MSRKSYSGNKSATRRAVSAGLGAAALAGFAPFNIVRAQTAALKVGVLLPRSGVQAGIGQDAQRRAEAIATPNMALRITIYVAITAGLLGLVVVALVLTQLIHPQMGNEIFGLFQGIDAAMNITVLTGAALLAITAALYASAGWGGVCILGAVTALLALGVWAVTEAARGRARRSEVRTAVCAGAGD